MLFKPKRFSYLPFQAVSGNGISQRFTDRYPKPRKTTVIIGCEEYKLLIPNAAPFVENSFKLFV